MSTNLLQQSIELWGQGHRLDVHIVEGCQFKKPLTKPAFSALEPKQAAGAFVHPKQAYPQSFVLRILPAQRRIQFRRSDKTLLWAGGKECREVESEPLAASVDSRLATYWQCRLACSASSR